VEFVFVIMLLWHRPFVMRRRYNQSLWVLVLFLLVMHAAMWSSMAAAFALLNMDRKNNA